MKFAIITDFGFPGSPDRPEDAAIVLLQFEIGTIRIDTRRPDKFTFYPRLGIQSLYDEDDWNELSNVVFVMDPQPGSTWRYDGCINMSLADGLMYARQILPLWLGDTMAPLPQV